MEDPGTRLALALAASGNGVELVFEAEAVGDDAAAALAVQLSTFAEGLASRPDLPVGKIPLLTGDERRRLLIDWNQTQRGFPQDRTIPDRIEEQVGKTPDAVAVVCGEESLTYRELDSRANRLAAHLQKLGVGPEELVGICLDRSLDLIVGLLGVLKAGGAYVPLDPEYPWERLTVMLEDARPRVLLTQERLRARLPSTSAHVLCLDSGWEEIAREPAGPVSRRLSPENLAYVLFTSGSTGRPKGVMVTHRNVVNFFGAMDERLGTAAGVWLAITTVSFDISVLELFWTLTRGFRVVLQRREVTAALPGKRRDRTARRVDFSLFYFASDAGESAGEGYRLLLEGARFADTHDFAAVWTPERHFHAFGGLFPNPSVTGAAVAAVTRRVAVRAGSVVMPLHNPLRVAEEWAVVDNLSGGRVGIAFASGWHANDFAFAPGSYADRKRVTFAGLETVRRLWRGETVPARSGDEKEIAVRVLPPPVQRELPFWVTTAGNVETFREAGQIGANVLTNLLGQDVEELARKISAYRQARREADHRGEGIVTVMVHTYLGTDAAAVRERVRAPFSRYLASSFDLIKMAPWAFPAFRQPSKASSDGPAFDAEGFTSEDMDALIAHAFERYFETAGLFGTPDSCLPMVERLREIGVDEFACLIDFGVDTDSVLESLRHLDALRQRCVSLSAEDSDESIAAQIRRHGVTHLQCTPSFAGLLVSDPESRDALGSLRKLLVGGEALSEKLAGELCRAVAGEIHNMYGPTETTVWSTASRVGQEGSVTIGRPIANTEVFILDRNLEPTPVGVPGEIYIGGAGVARGYLHRPDLTAERFVPHPFSTEPGARLYRTGDRGRYRADGRIEFLGRADDQVKIRGHRVEPREIEAVLAKHPEVAEGAVVARDDGTGLGLVAYFVPRVESGSGGAGAVVGAWRQVWDETYRGAGSSTTAETAPFETVGWRSSATGEPISAEEMREWVDGTVGRVLALGPRRVLEIGCGTGLLLSRIAPKCERYEGSDFSSVGLEWLERQVQARGSVLSNVSLAQRPADDFADVAEGSVDTVILNSVVQYFPSAEYLLRVLEGAVRSVGARGSILVGDVRSLPLWKAFQASVELDRAPGSLSREAWRERVERAMSREEELLVDPDFFRSLPRVFPQIRQVQVWAKRGRHENELTCFRYDVILRIGEEIIQPDDALQLDWVRDVVTLPGLRERLGKEKPAGLVARAVPDSRLRRAMELTKWLENGSGPASVGAMREAIERLDGDGVDPENLWSLGRESGYDVELVPTRDTPGFLDAILRRTDIAGSAARVSSAPPSGRQSSLPPEVWEEFTNRPARAKGSGSGGGADLERRLRSFLERRLPSYMVPSRFLRMSELPRTPNGKLDRKSLPPPAEIPSEADATFVPPRNPIEEVVAEICAEVLGLDRVDVTANFFELGGHSLLATQAISRLRDSFQTELPLRVIFESPTVEALAREIAGRESEPGRSERIARVLQRLESMSDGEVLAALAKKGRGEELSR
ncbi:MAG TPA: MupA/Atu3671 family FMN-dependent luciferase-like monooxygenase [Thermoanaerobaculia bacterium]|nr:MupA/Atu3671 family FMN-dependent luciferase-like monooxygenase [Thermoanaerobaculia bacterium]